MINNISKKIKFGTPKINKINLQIAVNENIIK